MGELHMKTFCHVPIELEDLKTQTIDKKRFYETPDGNLYPSITTVLSVRNKKGLFEWRKRVGDEVANYVAVKAANRGTAVHHMCEDYLNCLLYTSPSPRDKRQSRMPSSA